MNADGHLNELQIINLKEACPTLGEGLLSEIKATFEEFADADFEDSDEEDEDEEGEERKEHDIIEKLKKTHITNKERLETTDFGILLGMFLALGCDVELPSAKELYQRVKQPAEYEEGKISLNVIEFARMINFFVDEQCDPVDGLLETIADAYDIENTGTCHYEQIIEFLEMHQYLGADRQAVVNTLESYRVEERIEYVKAIKNLIQ